MVEQRKAPEPGSAEDVLYDMLGFVIPEHEIWHMPFDGGHRIRISRSLLPQHGAELEEGVCGYLIGPDDVPRCYWHYATRASEPQSREWLERFFADQARQWLAHHDKQGENA